MKNTLTYTYELTKRTRWKRNVAKPSGILHIFL